MELGLTQISDLIKIFPPRPVKVISRGMWLNQFFHELEKDWNGAEPLNRLRVGVAMKRFQDWELPCLWKLCNESQSFAKFFWWKVKMKPVIHRPKKPKTLQLKLK